MKLRGNVNDHLLPKVATAFYILVAYRELNNLFQLMYLLGVKYNK